MIVVIAERLATRGTSRGHAAGFIGILLLAGTLASNLSHAQSLDEQLRAAEYFRARGAVVELGRRNVDDSPDSDDDGQDSSVARISFPLALREVTVIPELGVVVNPPKPDRRSLFRYSVGEGAGPHWKQLGRISILEVPSSDFGDDELEAIRSLPLLAALDVGFTDVSDEGLAHVAHLKSLRDLNLEDTDITDNGLRHLSGLSHLQSLNLSRTRVTDEGLRHLKGLPKLVMLDLAETRITDEGLLHLRNLDALQALNLRKTKITDEGVPHLSMLRQLSQLDLSGSLVSPDRMATLEKKWPRESFGLRDGRRLHDAVDALLGRKLDQEMIDKK